MCFSKNTQVKVEVEVEVEVKVKVKKEKLQGNVPDFFSSCST